jgi:hypothetical protein
MEKHELSKYLQTKNADAEYLRELQQQLDEEMEKPVEEQDLDRIDELTKAISVLNGTDEFLAQRAEHGIRQLRQTVLRTRRKKRIRRSAYAAVCACAVLAVSNVCSYIAYGTDAFSAVYQIIKGGITFDLTQQSDTPSETGNPYLQEMQQICAEHDMDILLPSYIPAGFEPASETYIGYHKLNGSQNIKFDFRKKKIKLQFIAEEYFSIGNYTPMCIPSDEYNVSVQTINGNSIYITKEDKQFNAIFLIGNIQYAIFTDGLDYDECQRVLESFFI